MIASGITIGSVFGFIMAFAMFIYWIGTFIILYHLIRFGVSGQPKKIALIFLGGSLVLTMITLLLYTQVDFTGVESLLTLRGLQVDIGNF